MSKVYIGIDPGLTGAVSVIKRSGKVKIFDTPIEEIKKENLSTRISARKHGRYSYKNHKSLWE